MYVRDLKGNEFAIMATTKSDIHLNSDHSIDIVIEYNKVNKDFIGDVARLWSFFDNDDTEYIVIHIQKIGKGKYQQVNLKAIPKFYDVMKSDRIYEEHKGSITFNRACTLLFKGTPFSFIQHDKFDAVEWEGFGAGESKADTLKRILNRYGAEFEVIGDNVHFKKLVGVDTNIMYAHRLNASDIQIDVDASEYYTFARGYGDYGTEEEGDGESTDWQDAKLIRTYTSPLEKIIGRRRHAPPIKDGRITQRQTLDDRLKTLVEESLKISVTLTMHQIQKQGYEDYVPNVGDRIILYDDRIGLNDEVRVQQVNIVRNWKNDILDFQAVVGSPSIVKRYQSQLSGAIKSITDILEGKTKLPFNVLDNAVINATKALQNAQTELYFPTTGGILAVDKTNPNLVTLFNSAGIGVSSDGGRTFTNAITGEGIVAEAIMAGVVHGLVLEGGEVLGGKFTTIGGKSHIEIQNGILKTFDDGSKASELSGIGQRFFFDDYDIGIIGASSWQDRPNYRGIRFGLDTNAHYMNWGYRENVNDDFFRTVMSWHKNNSVMPKGLNFSDTVTAHGPVHIESNDLKVGGKLEARSTANGIRIGVDVSNNGTYIYINDDGQVGFVSNGNIFQSFNPY